jgi:antirestriction protein ArdC
MRPDLAATITEKLLDLMTKHGSNWRQPWTGSGLYRNAVSKKPYRGVNQLITAISGHASPFFATYRQWGELGAQVRKGEKATAIFFFKPYAIKDRETEEEKQIMLARSYSVFNAAQVDNPPPLVVEKRPEIERHAECERIIAATGAAVSYGGDKAAFIPSLDRIVMPTANQFESRDAFYSTHFHELGHWSGAPQRLDRNLKGRFGDPAYAFEELIAETSAAFICAAIGIIPEPRTETAQYLNGWMRGMRDDKGAIIRAFSHAQRAADFILKDNAPAPEAEPTRPENEPSQPAAPTKEI